MLVAADKPHHAWPWRKKLGPSSPLGRGKGRRALGLGKYVNPYVMIVSVKARTPLT